MYTSKYSWPYVIQFNQNVKKQYYFRIQTVGQIPYLLVKYSFIIILDMIDRALNFSTGAQAESYYFQFVPTTLSVLGHESEFPSKETTYRFAIFKAQQQLDDSKIPIEALFQQNNGVPELVIQTCRLNFNLPSFNRLRKQEFILRLFQTEGSQEYDIADYTIDASAIIASFKESGQNCHQFTIFLSKTYGLKFQIYIEKTRAALEKSTKRFIVENDKLTTSVVKKEYKTMTPTKANFDQSDSKVSVTEQKVTPVQPNRKSPLPRFEEQSVKGSEKNDIVSQKSNGSKVPLIQTKLKAVPKKDAPAEIKLAESQRLSVVTDSSIEPPKVKVDGDPEWKQKLSLWIFLAVGAIIMYIAMHPNRKV